ncbi:MAG: hypothetical protein ACI9F9_002315 [Candidatus Paceibacteria bacterium]|jgi:hypothetical protein
MNRFTLKLVVLSFVLHSSVPLLLAQEKASVPPDALQIALDQMGIQQADLGYRPQGHWARYPSSRTVPHVMPFFDDLLARPLDTYGFTRMLGNAVEDHLTLAALRNTEGMPETLFQLVVKLGTDHSLGGFRGHSCNLDPRPWEQEPLLHALVTLLERSGAPLRRPMSFGARFSTDSPGPRELLRRKVAAIPEALRLPLARYVLNLIQAHEWIDLGLRKVPRELRRDLYSAMNSLASQTGDGTGYHSAVDDVVGLIDQHSLHYGALKALQATQNARRELGTALATMEEVPSFRFQMQSPWGGLRFDNQAQALRNVESSLCLVDFTGSGQWTGGVGATDIDTTLSVALLLDFGGRVGLVEGASVQAPGESRRVASGVLGCGLLYSSGDQDTSYAAAKWSLGAALCGLGALIDEGGSDRYELAELGQGAAYFGIGLLLDAAGDDEYVLREGDGQGMGGPGGVGVLADRSGNDVYYAEPSAAKAGRADYHSAGEVAANNAQGVGSGRRGDGSDGHSWAGGLGALLDVDGDDKYTAGNFSQGLGYWYGTGLLWDGGGNDEYESVYFTQGSGAHFAIGALIDEGGDDSHVLGFTAGAAFGFGWDVVNAFLIDRGAGNDRYEAKIISAGLAQVRSNAFFIDEGGDDVYLLSEGTPGFGDVDTRETYTVPGRTADFPFRLTQVGVFLDLAGNDQYWRRGKVDAPLRPDQEASDGSQWNLRVRDAKLKAAPNVSFGGDFDGARAGFLDPWPARR